MSELDYTTIAIITALNTFVAITVKEIFDLIKDWRRRLWEKKKKNGF